MNWFKQHGDTIAILTTFALAFWTLNGKIDDRFSTINQKMTDIEKDITVIKTVLIMQNILPSELASNEGDKQ